MGTSAKIMPSKHLIQHLFISAIELIFPPRCASCGRVDTYWCERCQEALDQIPVETRLKLVENDLTVACTGVHMGQLQKSIHALKYENLKLIASPLGQRLAACLVQLDWDADIIVPVPLYPKRLAERGYNQAELLGNQITSRLSIPCVPHAITRTQETRSQVGLDRKQRLLNVAEAFGANPEYVANKTVLLVDDVCTTGATLSTCAQAALAAGARAVYGLTVTEARGSL